jgi:Zn-dependent metalloprotease
VYGQLFGLRDQSRELEVMRTSAEARGRSFVRFQQVHRAVPVLGGELIVQLDGRGHVISASGEVLPGLHVDTTPVIDAVSARSRALSTVARAHGLSSDDLTTTEPTLWIHNPALLGGPGPRLSTLVYRLEVQSKVGLPIRELVLVDAHLGSVILHFNQIDGVRNRVIYDNKNRHHYGLPGNGPVRTEGQDPTGIAEADNAYDYAGFTYDFYAAVHGRDSIDDSGMDLISTVRYCPDPRNCPYGNAYWNGAQMVYGDGYASADDVVAHELTHGVTDHESHLFYYMQSGAINEGFSDIWGELVDQSFSNGNDTDTPAVLWLMGEDIPGGAIRSMRNPPAYDSGLGSMPDRMTSTNYYCDEPDNGGVHHNVGVADKAAYLLAAGDTFNGHTVTGIGITKTAQIFYEVQTNLFTSAGDYQDLYDSLYQACLNLIGTGGITAGDCLEVRDATDATEMDQQPTACGATHAPICDSGSPTELFYDDMEDSSGGYWTSAAIVGSDEWYYPQNSNPYDFDATYATSGVTNIWGYDQPDVADITMAMTLDVALPASSQPVLHFQHGYAFDQDPPTMYDGGVLEYSTDGGGTWHDAGALFTHNGCNGTISTVESNPLGGRAGFVGDSHGYISSRLDLSSLAGQGVRFRFRIGTGANVDDLGWFIDDVRLATCGDTPCTDPPATPTSPSPADGATEVFPTTHLSWTGGHPCAGEAVTYDVLLGTSGPPTDLICDDVSAAACDIGPLEFGTTYTWQVVAQGLNGPAPGPVWSFTTYVDAGLAISVVSEDVQLNWSDVGATVDHYEVWRSADPYFQPGDVGSVKIGDDIPPNPGSTVSHTDTASHLGDPATNDYYIVLAVDDAGQASPVSNRVGAFDFALEPGLPEYVTNAG